MARAPSCLCGECRKCKHRIYMRGWYQAKSPEERRAWVARRDKEKVRARDRERYHEDPVRRQYSNEQARRWSITNPEKHKAHYMVGNAVRSGKLIRQPCEVCGAAYVHGHHDDYSKPLEVRWLCPIHHAEQRTSSI